MADPRNDLPRQLGERCFVDDDQQRFAAESHDFNPMHVDAVAARRLLSGRQVVHGVHTLIQALDLWQPPAGADGWSVQCNFAHPVNVGDRVDFTATQNAQGRHRLSAVVEGLVSTDVVLRRVEGEAGPSGLGDAPARPIGPLAAPLDEPAHAWVDQCLEIVPWQDRLATWYPRAAALVGAAALTDLARLSFVVGMVCPGLHSVFSSLQFAPTGLAARAPLRLKVTRYDPRFRMFFIAFRGAVQGELRAFLRPPPQAQPRAAELVGRVEPRSWAGRRALVVGGSRGLGELMAKMLAAAGCYVTISHARGGDDAMAVAEDILSLGAGQCDTVALDLSRSFEPPQALRAAELDAVFYFATPRIQTKRSGVFHRGAFDEFAGFYLERFYELCLWLEGGGRPVRVYLPSTVFVTERPRGMTEYAMAKAAAELLADDLNRTLRHVRIVHTRLPRLATDQTASITPLATADNVGALLEVMQAMRD